MPLTSSSIRSGSEQCSILQPMAAKITYTNVLYSALELDALRSNSVPKVNLSIPGKTDQYRVNVFNPDAEAQAPGKLPVNNEALWSEADDVLQEIPSLG